MFQVDSFVKKGSEFPLWEYLLAATANTKGSRVRKAVAFVKHLEIWTSHETIQATDHHGTAALLRSGCACMGRSVLRISTADNALHEVDMLHCFLHASDPI